MTGRSGKRRKILTSTLALPPMPQREADSAVSLPLFSHPRDETRSRDRLGWARSRQTQRAYDILDVRRLTCVDRLGFIVLPKALFRDRDAPKGTALRVGIWIKQREQAYYRSERALRIASHPTPHRGVYAPSRHLGVFTLSRARGSRLLISRLTIWI